jgi:exodeoxyribonuclease III
MNLKVLSYNILEGGEDRLRDIRDIIRAQCPDAIALVEATSHANVESLARELEMQLVFGEANNEYHIAWLSRLPILWSENHRLATLSKTLLEIGVAWNNDQLRLFATHLAASRDIHQPVTEVPAIIDVLRPLAGQPHLLVGDFNAVRPGDPAGIPPSRRGNWDETVDGVHRQSQSLAIQFILDNGYIDCYRLLHPLIPGYTYQSDDPWTRLDYIFASPDLVHRLRACDVVTGAETERASDHFPIWVEFS